MLHDSISLTLAFSFSMSFALSIPYKKVLLIFLLIKKVRKSLEKMLNLIMELEVEAKTNAAKYERTEKRKANLNGRRTRGLSTGVGEVTLQAAARDLKTGKVIEQY